MARARSEDMKTPLARLSYPNLFKPRKNDKGEEIYGAVLLFPKGTDLSKLQDAALKAAVEQWGDKAKEMIKSGAIKHPFLDGDGPQGVSKKTGERHLGYEGHIFLRCSSQQKPKVFTKAVAPASEEDAYAGCYGYGVVNAFAWEHPTNGRGISFGLSMFQVAKDGERFGREVDPDKYFEAIADEGSAPAATQQGAGASGLFA